MDRILIKDKKKTGPRAANESTKSRDDPGQDYFQTFYSHRAAFHSTEEIQNCGTNTVLESMTGKSCFKTPIELAQSCGSQRQ